MSHALARPIGRARLPIPFWLLEQEREVGIEPTGRCRKYLLYLPYALLELCTPVPRLLARCGDRYPVGGRVGDVSDP